MGRTLETLKVGEASRQSAKPKAMPSTPECVVEWTLPEEEIPFVEIGGPDRKVEFSPGLLVKHAAQTPQAPHKPVEERVTLTPSATSAIIGLTETKPMTVEYQTWPNVQVAPHGIASDVIVYHQPTHAISKEYNQLLKTILANVQGPGARILLLLGIRPKVGTSTVLLNLAASAASEQGKRVVAVDFDLEHPSLAVRLGQAPTASFQTVVGGELALEKAIHKTTVQALDVVPAYYLGRKAGPLTREALAWLTGWLRERYDLVFVDGPSLDRLGDLNLLLPSCDAVFMVAPQGEATAVGKGPAQNLLRMGGTLRGVIHTHLAI